MATTREFASSDAQVHAMLQLGTQQLHVASIGPERDHMDNQWNVSSKPAIDA